jgi:hypothetical protein
MRVNQKICLQVKHLLNALAQTTMALLRNIGVVSKRKIGGEEIRWFPVLLQATWQ